MQDLKNYIRILAYLKPYKWVVLVVTLCSFFVAASFAGSIGGIKPAADLLFGEFQVETYRKIPFMDTEWGTAFLNGLQEMVARDKFRTLMVIASIVVFLSILRSLFKFVHGYLGAYLANRMRMDISLELHDKIMDQSLSFFSKEGVANTIAVLSYDANNIHRGATIIFDKLLLEPLNIVAALAIAFILNAKLACVAAIGFPLIGYAVNHSGAKLRKAPGKP